MLVVVISSSSAAKTTAPDLAGTEIPAKAVSSFTAAFQRPSVSFT